MRLFYAYTLLVLGVFATACDSEEPPTEDKPDYKRLIVGEWQMDRGLQDGTISDRFDGFSFSFTNDSMESALLEAMTGVERAVYTIESERIILTDEPGVVFTIKQLNKDTLRLAFEARESVFDFSLKKGRDKNAADEENNTAGTVSDSLGETQGVPE